MQSHIDTYRLHNGVQIPCIGFGTWRVENGDEALRCVSQALECGYRHIDTAAGYENEKSVGQAIRESGVDRGTLFVTSKLHNSKHGYKNTLEAFDQTMDDLGLEYLDLYLIHWPNPIAFRQSWKESNAGTWQAFEELYSAGKIRAIGISNFREHHIDALLETARVLPMVNQIRLCPGDPQEGLVSFCRRHKMIVEAYSPFAGGEIFSVPELAEIAAKYNKTAAQFAVKWSLQSGFLPLPKSVTKERMAANLEVFDFTITSDDMTRIAQLDGCCGYSKDPDTTQF